MQQFFDPAFARRWFRRIGRFRVPTGGDLADLPDEEILRIAEEEQAGVVVLPTARAADLEELTRGAEWALYRVRRQPPPVHSQGPVEPHRARLEVQERSLRDIVWPNIDRHRKRDAVVRFADAEGTPITDTYLEIRHRCHLFGSATARFHFLPPPAQSWSLGAPQVDPRWLSRFLELFNYPVIGYSGKCDAIERQPLRAISLEREDAT